MKHTVLIHIGCLQDGNCSDGQTNCKNPPVLCWQHHPGEGLFGESNAVVGWERKVVMMNNRMVFVLSCVHLLYDCHGEDKYPMVDVVWIAKRCVWGKKSKEGMVKVGDDWVLKKSAHGRCYYDKVHGIACSFRYDYSSCSCSCWELFCGCCCVWWEIFGLWCFGFIGISL